MIFHILNFCRGKSGTKSLVCGGSILSSDTILTAAHCDINVHEEHVAVVGDHDLTKNDGNEQRIPILDFIPHPEYGISTVDDNDFGIVKLAEPIKFTDYVGTICLPYGEKNYDNVTAKVSGWGRIHDDGPRSNVLQQVKEVFVEFWIRPCLCLCRSRNF